MQTDRAHYEAKHHTPDNIGDPYGPEALKPSERRDDLEKVFEHQERISGRMASHLSEVGSVLAAQLAENPRKHGRILQKSMDGLIENGRQSVHKVEKQPDTVFDRFQNRISRAYLLMPQFVNDQKAIDEEREYRAATQHLGRDLWTNADQKKLNAVIERAAAWQNDGISTMMFNYLIRKQPASGLFNEMVQLHQMYGNYRTFEEAKGEAVARIIGMAGPALSILALSQHRGVDVSIAPPYWDAIGGIDLAVVPRNGKVKGKVKEVHLLQIKSSTKHLPDNRNLEICMKSDPSNDEEEATLLRMEEFASRLQEFSSEWKGVAIKPYFCYTHMDPDVLRGKSPLRNPHVYLEHGKEEYGER